MFDTHTCRICCKQCQYDYKNLFDVNKGDIINKIFSCANILIQTDDQLPKLICSTCESELNFAYDFRLKCEKSDLFLREKWIQSVIDKLNYSRLNAEIKNCTQNLSNDTANNRSSFESRMEDNDLTMIGCEEVLNEQNKICGQTLTENNENGNSLKIKMKNEYTNYEIIIENQVNTSINTKTDFANQLECKSIQLNTEKPNLKPSKKKIKLVFHKPKEFLKLKKAYKCKTCNEILSTISDYSEHLSSHGKKRFQCEFCEYGANNKHRLKNHIEEVHDKKTRSLCSECGKSFNCLRNMKRHIKDTHERNGRKPFICELCDVTFSRKTSLKTHVMYKHSDKSMFICDICQKPIKGSGIYRHRLTHMSQEEKAKKFKNTNFNRTNRKYSSEIHECTICLKILSSKFMLSLHMKSHSGEKNFCCDLCDEKFVYITGLQQHKKYAHERQKRFKCETCDEPFSLAKLLTRHRLTEHKGKTLFECEICEKKYSRKNNLAMHIKIIHNGVVPFQCNICEKKFRYSHQLKKHSKEEHNENVQET